jgi:hypothetical protein
MKQIIGAPIQRIESRIEVIDKGAFAERKRERIIMIRKNNEGSTSKKERTITARISPFDSSLLSFEFFSVPKNNDFDFQNPIIPSTGRITRAKSISKNIIISDIEKELPILTIKRIDKGSISILFPIRTTEKIINRILATV